MTKSYPTLEDIPELLEMETVELQSISWRRSSKLEKFQLEFTEGLVTPVFATAGTANSNSGLGKKRLDPDYGRFTQVSVLLVPGGWISGFRFLYSTFKDDYVELSPHYHGGSVWETRDIPEGYQIVGLFVNDRVDSNNFALFGFNLLPIDLQFKP